MFSQEHLTLRLGRLRPSEKWVPGTSGLSFVFLKGGWGRYISITATQPLAPGDVLVLNETGKDQGCLSADEGNEMVFGFFATNLEHLFPLFASNEIYLMQHIPAVFKGARWYEASTALAKECHRLLADVPPPFNLDHRSQLLRVVAAILSAEFKDIQPHHIGIVRAEEHMAQVFEKLTANELMNLSVEKLATRFGCSKRHLNRQFHRHFGFSVAAMKMEMRLLKAASLLRDPDIKVINVAEQCGFHHLGLFNTYFKRRFGASPGQWRQMSAQTEGQLVRAVNGGLVCPLRSKGFCQWVPDSGSNDPTAPNQQKIAGAAS